MIVPGGRRPCRDARDDHAGARSAGLSGFSMVVAMAVTPACCAAVASSVRVRAPARGGLR